MLIVENRCADLFVFNRREAISSAMRANRITFAIGTAPSPRQSYAVRRSLTCGFDATAESLVKRSKQGGYIDNTVALAAVPASVVVLRLLTERGGDLIAAGDLALLRCS